jgi:hypothetical protein
MKFAAAAIEIAEARQESASNPGAVGLCNVS